jgi:hypothetical protein
VEWNYSDNPLRRFRIDNVPPGVYDLFLLQVAQGLFETESSSPLGRVEIRVSQDMDGIRIAPEPGVEVMGRFIGMRNGIRPAGGARLHLLPQGVSTQQVPVDASGAFTVPGVIGGEWRVAVSQLEPNLAVRDIRQGGASIYESGFRVQSRTPDPIEVLLTAAGGIEGVVRDASQQIAGFARVALIPAGENRSNLALHRETLADGNGAFAMDAVAEGDYMLFAISPSPGGLSGPRGARELGAFLESYANQGTPVSVRAGNRTRTSPVAIAR